MVVKFGDALDTEEKRKQALSLLMISKGGQFWQLLINILDYNINTIEDQILNDDELKAEKREELRWRRYYMVELRNLPDNLISNLTPDVPSTHETELDPYN